MQKIRMAMDAVVDASILAEPVFDAHQQVLLAVGTVLTPARLASLRDRGVAQVVIEQAEPAPLSDEDSLALLAQKNERLQYLFRHSLQAGQANPLLPMVVRFRREVLPP